MADEAVFIREEVSDAPDQIPPAPGDFERDDLPEGNILIKLQAGLTGKGDAHDYRDEEATDGRSP